MSSSYEDILEKVSKEIVKKTKEKLGDEIKSSLIDDTLAAFIIRAVVLKPDSGFDFSKDLSHEQLANLIKVFKMLLKTDMCS
jgi:hypothetical protein